MTKFLVKLFVKDYQNTNNPIVRERYGKLGSITGIIFNIILFSLKLFGGIIALSISIIADAFNNLFDALTAIVTLIGFKYANKPADKEHPFGHGRFEYLASLFIAIIIIVVGVELFRTSISELIDVKQLVKIEMFSVIVLVISLVLKAWLGYFNLKLGKKISSLAMQAYAKDSILDVIATSVVLIGLLIGHFASINIDGYLGALVALFIIYTGFKTVKETIDPLLGQSPSPEFINAIEEKILSYNGIYGIHDLIVHDYGPSRTIISLHVEVDADSDFLEMHDLIDNIERDIRRYFNCSITIHMDPLQLHDKDTNLIQTQLLKILEKIDPILSIHDFRIVKGPTHTNIIFDLVIPYNYKYNEEQLHQMIQDEITKINPNYYIVIADIDH
ncbi:TPA: cation transporter [bacterium]|nr:cation transporter [bacterium]